VHILVRLAGIEPTTPWFVAKYSIQLSYSRNSHNYAMEEKNYITPAGHARLRAELLQLLDVERPKIVEIVHWAASNGDRSENGDYIYGKKRLREIDRRIRFLNKRLEFAVLVDNANRVSGDQDADQVFFGATVTYCPTSGSANGKEEKITIVGVDEVDLEKGYVSWVSPIARALIKARIGECVRIQTPKGPAEIEILDVEYCS
jgi:transcription elongation factor GreB